MAEEDRQVVNLSGAYVNVITGPDVQTSAQRHRKSGFAGIGTTKVAVLEFGLIARDAKQRVRVRNERRRVAPVEARSTQQ